MPQNVIGTDETVQEANLGCVLNTEQKSVWILRQNSRLDTPMVTDRASSFVVCLAAAVSWAYF